MSNDGQLGVDYCHTMQSNDNFNVFQDIKSYSHIIDAFILM